MATVCRVVLRWLQHSPHFDASIGFVLCTCTCQDPSNAIILNMQRSESRCGQWRGRICVPQYPSSRSDRAPFVFRTEPGSEDVCFQAAVPIGTSKKKGPSAYLLRARTCSEPYVRTGLSKISVACNQANKKILP